MPIQPLMRCVYSHGRAGGRRRRGRAAVRAHLCWPCPWLPGAWQRLCHRSVIAAERAVVLEPAAVAQVARCPLCAAIARRAAPQGEVGAPRAGVA